MKKDGERTVVEKQQRVLPWWRSVPNGTYAFFIRVGFKPIEFAKDKTAIAVPSLDKLPAVNSRRGVALAAPPLPAFGFSHLGDRTTVT